MRLFRTDIQGAAGKSIGILRLTAFGVNFDLGTQTVHRASVRDLGKLKEVDELIDKVSPSLMRRTLMVRIALSRILP
jgi:hypothetical protein